jgi:hypothetical protein
VKDLLAVEEAVPQRDTIIWNIALIRLTAEGRAQQARSGTYPLLEHLFYGDYTAVLGILSGYRAEELFSRPNPLIVGTVAEGFEEPLADYIRTYTTRALAVQPDLAAAYLLRGWAHYLTDPTSPQALADVERAAELEPEIPLLADSAAYLRSGGQVTDDAQAVRATALAYAQASTTADRDYLVAIEKLEGDFARVSIAPADGSAAPRTIFLQRQDGVWSVLAPTEDPDDYRERGVPDELLHDLPPAPPS